MKVIDRNFGMLCNSLACLAVFALAVSAAQLPVARAELNGTSLLVTVDDVGGVRGTVVPLPVGCDTGKVSGTEVDSRGNVVVLFSASAAANEQPNRGGIFTVMGWRRGADFKQPYGIIRNGTDFTVDEPRLLVDTWSGQYPDRTYIIWRAALKRNGVPTHQLLFSWAAHGGGPYSRPLPLDGPSVKEITNVAITGSANGDIAVSWDETVGGTTHSRERISNNGGISFLVY